MTVASLRKIVRIGSLAGLLAAGWSAKGALSAEPAPAIARPLAEHLAVLAAGRSVTDAELASAPTVSAYVDGLLSSPEFKTLIPAQVLLSGGVARPVKDDEFAWLRSKQVAGGKVLYWLNEPCRIGEAEAVHPWWAPESEVLVCRDSYNPDVTKVGTFYCGSPGAYRDDAKLPPDQRCGCGPNLIYCASSKKHAAELSASATAEVQGTLAYVVDHDLPVDQLFLGNETFRDRNMEVFYRRWQYSSGRPLDLSGLAEWPEHGRWAPRPELPNGKHAGILTTPWALAAETGARARQKIWYELLWCEEPRSAHVPTSTVLGLGTADVRAGDGWEKLAAMPVCTDCHARLDYGMQFFSGFMFNYAYDGRNQRQGVGKLFGTDLHDERGEAPLTELGFATLATQQKEYSSCIANRVGRYVLGDGLLPGDVKMLEEKFLADRRFKSLMRTAMLLLAERSQAKAMDVKQEESTTKAHLRDLVTQHCVDCHGQGDHEPVLDREDLSRETLLRMLDEVSFGRMPKKGGLGSVDRDELVRTLVASAWTGEKERRDALLYYSRMGGLRGVPRVPNSILLSAIQTRAGAPVDESLATKLETPESSVRPDVLRYDAETATLVAVEALKTCRKAESDQDGVKRCVAKATKLEGLLRPE
jgi:mono/diheme cytochrome c family protein